MIRLITGVILGIALTLFIVAGTYASTATSEQSNEGYEAGSTDGLSDHEKGDILDFLKQAGSEINDQDIAEYYQFLIEQYDLADNVTVCDNLDSLLNINKIVRQAAGLPLQKAGSNIRDAEIESFYHDFLEKVGWEFD
jgi:hypothetical protein